MHAAKQDADARKKEYRELLIEKGVTPFSRWDKELPKLICDKRYKAIPDQIQRRILFDQFVKGRAEELRREKRAALKLAAEGEESDRVGGTTPTKLERCSILPWEGTSLKTAPMCHRDR